MELEFLGHAFFKIFYKNKIILIDPFITGNPLISKNFELKKVNYIFVTHGHGDHLGDAIKLSQKYGCKVFGIVELINVLSEELGLKNGVGFNKGGTINVDDFFKVTMVKAEHSCSTMIKGKTVYSGEPVGFVFHLGENVIYHAGDTAVFSDMSLICELYSPNISLLPVGDFYTMGFKEFVKSVELLKSETIIPMHYKTFPVLNQDLNELKTSKIWDKIKVLRIEEKLNL